MAIDAAWLERIRARCDVAPVAPREAISLLAGGAPFGSIDAALAARLDGVGLAWRHHGDGWLVDASPGLAASAELKRIARHLEAIGQISAWRDELLPIVAGGSSSIDSADPCDAGVAVGLVERAAVRALGIATRAVHLVGISTSGCTWVQQRAADKTVDPGRWDTLMGGLVSAGESIATALARETLEEAGLRLDQLEGITSIGVFTVRRPLRDGYMIEHTHVFEATLPPGLAPVNQDGEVQRFERLTAAELEARLRAGEFTLEATRILGEALMRRQQLQ